MFYNSSMIATVKNLAEEIASWSKPDQEELLAVAREIEARRTGIYEITAEEWADLQEDIAQAVCRELVADDDIAEADKRRGV